MLCFHVEYRGFGVEQRLDLVVTCSEIEVVVVIRLQVFSSIDVYEGTDRCVLWSPHSDTNSIYSLPE